MSIEKSIGNLAASNPEEITEKDFDEVVEEIEKLHKQFERIHPFIRKGLEFHMKEKKGFGLFIDSHEK